MSFIQRRKSRSYPLADPSGYTRLDVEDARQGDDSHENFRVMDVSLLLGAFALGLLLLLFVTRPFD